MIATHPDADHVGELDKVLNAMNIKNVYALKVIHTPQTFKDFLITVANKGLTIKEAKSGLNLSINGLNSQFLAPVKEYGDDLNEWSTKTSTQACTRSNRKKICAIGGCATT